VGEPPRLEILKPGDEANFAKLKDAKDPSVAIAPALDLEAL
jgi:hypothetical protein